MERNKWRVSHERGAIRRRHTPRKQTLRRRHRFRKFVPSRHFKALLEEPEGEEVSVSPDKLSSPVWVQNPANTENLTHAASLAATPAHKKVGPQVSPIWHRAVQMSPGQEDFKGGDLPIQREVPNSQAVSPESITSSSMETDITFNFDDDEEDFYSSPLSSSSPPSPEIFREERHVETLTFPMEDELLSLDLHIKNSTLLDVSNAETIYIHHPPDLSTIIGASTILAEKSCDISNHTQTEAEVRLHTGSVQQDKQTQVSKWKTPEKINRKMPIKYKKKVSFKTPNIGEIYEVKHIPVTKLPTHKARESIQMSGLAQTVKPNAETSNVGEITFEDDTDHLKENLKKLTKSSSEKAKFFDFVTDSDSETFFQKMRERCVKLKGAPLFPLTVVKHTQTSPLSFLKQ